MMASATARLAGHLKQVKLNSMYNKQVSYARAINLSAGCAALPLPVLERAQREFLDTRDLGMSITELGYRTRNFHVEMEEAEASFRELMRVPDTHEVHFFNGGATLQFAAIPMNLWGGLKPQARKANYIMSGHWSEKSVREARLFSDAVNETWTDPTGLYFSVPEPSEWSIDPEATFMHYTAADTRQGFEWQEFPYDAVPKDMELVCDASANFGSKPVDISKYGVIFAAAHKNFSTSGVCYTVIRKDLINEDVLPGTPTMCNWHKFQTSDNKIYNVPVIFAIWLGRLTTEHMLDMGGLPYYEDLAKRRANILYDAISDSNGFYSTFVTDPRFMSRMNIVFTIGSGGEKGVGRNAELVQKFLKEASEDLGWLDIRSHPLGIESDAIRVTTYNPQPIETVEVVRDYMLEFQKRHQ